ncbi:MAG: hypothetical protein AAGE96_18170 [Cyanobacteria bacterium P01_G01_bin.19]
MNATSQSQIDMDKFTIQQLTQKWIDAWSPQDRPFTGEGLENIFATEENEILVFDNFDKFYKRRS